MNNHINNEEIIGYLNRILDDAKRESIDEHLLHCPECRAQLQESEQHYRRISNEITAKISGVAVPQQMSFAAIESRLQARRGLQGIWFKTAVSPALAFSTIGLILALAGLWRIVFSQHPTEQYLNASAFPSLACFFFMLATVDQYERAAFYIRPRLVVVALATALLWLGTAIIGVFNIFALGELAIASAVALGGSAAEAMPLFMVATYFGGGMFYIGLVIGGADYHIKNLGQPRSWKVFTITLLVQLFILILPNWVY